MESWELVAAERASVVDLLETLEPAQWEVQSLCPAWTVHGVVAHQVSALEARPADMVRAAVAGFGLPARTTRVLAQRWSDRSPEELVAGLRAQVANRFAPPGMGYRAPLTDLMVHRLDVAVPLGIEVDRPVASWAPVLAFLTSRIPMMGSIRGGRPQVTWRTTDLDWSSGQGPEVRGPAEAVGLTLSGRRGRLERLEGEGVPALEAWLAR
jgi:uncharacterized protein (TIGR03083 family)